MQETPLEIYAPSPISPEISAPTGNIPEDEAFLTVEILQLWEVYRAHKSNLKEDVQRLRTARHDLGRVLFHMKQTLAKPGRSGQWSAFLKERQIPRASADRLVQRYERSLDPSPNRLTESISEPTEEEIQKSLKAVLPRLRKMLRTPDSSYRFIDLLTTFLEGTHRRVTEDGIFILKPVPQAVPMALTAGEPMAEPEPVACGITVGTDQELI